MQVTMLQMLEKMLILVLADYDFTDKLGGALRYSQWEKLLVLLKSKFTIAPNYAITDSLGAILSIATLMLTQPLVTMRITIILHLSLPTLSKFILNKSF